MRNKKSVSMTLNHNCGYFSSVCSGIAGNGQGIAEGGDFSTKVQTKNEC